MGRPPCCDSQTNRGAWSEEEDRLLTDYIRRHGAGSWRSLPRDAGLLRCGKSCRLRWVNYLRPDIKRGGFTEEDDELIITLHAQHGSRWSLIASKMEGRTDNEIKNYWNSRIKKKLLARGIDPRTHQPLAARKPASPADNGDEEASSESSKGGPVVAAGESSGGPCNSGTTTEVGARAETPPEKGKGVDLGLSVGPLDSLSEAGPASFGSAAQPPAEEVAAPEGGVCLCLGFGIGGECSECNH